MDIILDDVLAILDEHYNNVKALDALNQSYSNYQWQIRKQCWTGAFAFQGISRF